MPWAFFGSVVGAVSIDNSWKEAGSNLWRAALLILDRMRVGLHDR